MIELSLDIEGGRADIGYAGDTLNTAIYLNRMLSGPHRVNFVTCVGEDPFSDRLCNFIEGQGVSTESIRRIPERMPGLYAISTDERGERSFYYWRDTSAARLLFQTGTRKPFEGLHGFDAIYLSAITLAILPAEIRSRLFDWIEAFRSSGGLFCFDSNYRPRLWQNAATARSAVETAWRLTDIALPSIDDEMLLFDDETEEKAIERLRGYGLSTGALKRGERGPLPILASVDPQPVFEPAPLVVDTTAAGDSFNGAFLAAIFSGAPVETAMKAGHDLAVQVVGHRGAILPV